MLVDSVFIVTLKPFIMNNKHDANVRKSTLVNFQLGLIVALVTTVLVMEIKSAVPVVKPDDVAVDNSEVETYFNPEFVIVKDKVEKKQPLKKIQKIIDVIDVIDDDTPAELFEDTELTTEPDITEIEPGDLVEKIEDPEIAPVPFIKVEFVPIFPGCEGLTTNAERRACMSSKINTIVQRKFDGDLASDLGLSGQQRIYVRFKIDKTGNVVDIQGRSTHPKLTKEGERMAGLIPKMKPGQQSNKPVEVIFDLPIVFNVKD